MSDWMHDFAVRLGTGLWWPVYEFLVDGGSRYFWLYCVTGILIALAAERYLAPTGARPLFSRETWLGVSARNDYVIVIVGAMLRITVLSWAFVNWRPIAAFIADTLRWLGVSGQATDGTALALGALMTVTLFLVDDFMRWWAHRMMHKVPELWEFHKVHHSAEELNFATAERHHPVEVILTSLCTTTSFGVVNGIFIGLFGDQLSVATVFGANAILVAFNIAGGVLRHSPAWISFGPRVERWVISPAMHQIHHSSKVEHFDKNLGSSLAVWDRWAETLHIPRGREIEGFGIGEETRDFRSLGVIYFRPFARAVELAHERIKALAPRRTAGTRP